MRVVGITVTTPEHAYEVTHRNDSDHLPVGLLVDYLAEGHRTFDALWPDDDDDRTGRVEVMYGDGEDEAAVLRDKAAALA